MHGEDATATSTHAVGAPEGAELRLTRAVERAQSGSRGQTLGTYIWEIEVFLSSSREWRIYKREMLPCLLSKVHRAVAREVIKMKAESLEEKRPLKRVR